MILVEGKAEIHCTIADPLELMANLTNLDSEGLPSTSRPAVTIEERAALIAGASMSPTAKATSFLKFETQDEGGILNGEHLTFGESIPNRIWSVGTFRSIAQGSIQWLSFTTRDQHCLTASDEGLVCVRSIPIRISVDPVKIESSDAEQADCAALIKRLPNKGAVKLVTGGYDPRTPEFFGEGTVEAQIAAMQWTAVPQLIRAANDVSLKPTQRALGLGLCSTRSPTSTIPPRPRGVLGPFVSRPNGWTALRLPDGKIITDSRSAGEGDSLDDKAQLEFAKVWKPWIERGYIQITQPPKASVSQPKSRNKLPRAEKRTHGHTSICSCEGVSGVLLTPFEFPARHGRQRLGVVQRLVSPGDVRHRSHPGRPTGR